MNSVDLKFHRDRANAFKQSVRVRDFVRVATWSAFVNRHRTTLLVAVSLLAGVLLSTLGERLLRGESRSVRLTENISVFEDRGEGERLRAVLGKGTLAEVTTHGSVSYLTVRVSFADKAPPYVEVPTTPPANTRVRLQRDVESP